MTIQFNGLEIAGKFGADGVSDGKLSSGEPYAWKKAEGNKTKHS